MSFGDLGGGRVLHTSLIDCWSEEYDADISVGPHMLQEYVQKAFDLRVTVIDKNVFACRIDSQAFIEYAVDMRRGLADKRMRHDLISLPSTVSKLCVDIVASLGLRFGAIDLVQDSTGNFQFLEINPNGQWAWIQDRTGAPIAASISEALTNNARS
jgi:glutathione synthase/RimK-type ligase-like ATP-grasp enzyme